MFFFIIMLELIFILTWFTVFSHVSENISCQFEEEHKVNVSMNLVQDILIDDTNEPHSVLDQVLDKGVLVLLENSFSFVCKPTLSVKNFNLFNRMSN